MHGSGALAARSTRRGSSTSCGCWFPGCVGTGKRLFGDGEPPSGFNLVDSKITTSGVVYSALTPAPFQFGEVGLEDGREKI